MNQRYKTAEKLLDRYEIQQILLGGMGVVYICHDQINDMIYALKTFQDKYLVSSSAKKRFVAEATIWVELGNFVNVVLAQEITHIDGKPYIILESVFDNDNLVSNLADQIKHGSINEQLAIDYAIQICLGMQYVQIKKPGLVHRDLRPQNILVAHNNIVKVTDFGIAVALNDIIPPELKYVGYPDYMSPEQYAGQKLDARSDIFSFGCIFYEMLTGHVFKKKSISSSDKHGLYNGVPVQLVQILRRCVCARPDNRYTCFLDIATDLKSYYDSAFTTHLHVETVEAFQDVSELTQSGEISKVRVTLGYGSDLDPKALLNKGDSLLKLGHDKEALEYFDRWLMNIDQNIGLDRIEHDQTPPSEYVLMTIVTPIGEADFKLPSYDMKALVAQVYLWKAIALKNLGRLEETKSFYQKALSLNPKDSNTWYNFGEFLFNELRDVPNAISAYQEALRLDPRDDMAWNSLGFVLYESGQKKQGLECYDRALEINPRLIGALGNKGVALFWQGRISDARECFEMLIQIDPGEAIAWYYKGLILFSTHNKDALDCLVRANRLSPNNSAIQAALHKVSTYFSGDTSR